MIKYNHYKTEFKHVDGMISWDDIDEEYCFSDVFEDGYELKMIMEVEGTDYGQMTKEYKEDNYLLC